MEKMFMVKDGWLTITMPEEMDHHKAEEIREGADDYLLTGKVLHVIFDFSNTKFMDSSGIGVIAGRYKRFPATGEKWWRLMQIPESVKSLCFQD